MARQRNLGKPFWISLGILFAMALAFVVAQAVIRSNDPLGKLAVFPASDYLRGEMLGAPAEFVVRGTLKNIVMNSADGKVSLLTILPEDHPQLIPVVFETGSASFPLSKEQRLRMKVKVGKQGEVVASAISKL